MSAEQRERKRHSNRHYREHNREKLAAAETVRRLAKRATITPEEHETLKRRRNAGQRRRYHASLEKSREKGRAHQKARRAALPPKAPRTKQDPHVAKERKIQWNKAHPETCRAACKKWRTANPEKVKAANERRPKPLPRNLARELAYRAAHVLEARQRAAAWRKANPARAKANTLASKARRKNAPINDVTAEQRQLVIDTAHGVCKYCPHYNPDCKACAKGSHKLTIDHITAIINGGPHTLHNLVACCLVCNSRKKANKNPVPVQPLLL